MRLWCRRSDLHKPQSAQNSDRDPGPKSLGFIGVRIIDAIGFRVGGFGMLLCGTACCDHYVLQVRL